MRKLLGTNALARELGITPAAVSKAAKEKRIRAAKTEKGRPLYDVEKCRTAGLADNLQSMRPSKAAPVVAAPEDQSTDANAPDSPNNRYILARALKEEAQAEKAQLELEMLRKTLLPRDELKVTFTQYLRVASQNFSGLAPKMLTRFPGLSPEGRDFLASEIQRILDDLGKWKPGK